MNCPTESQLYDVLWQKDTSKRRRHVKGCKECLRRLREDILFPDTTWEDVWNKNFDTKDVIRRFFQLQGKSLPAAKEAEYQDQCRPTEIPKGKFRVMGKDRIDLLGEKSWLERDYDDFDEAVATRTRIWAIVFMILIATEHSRLPPIVGRACPPKFK